MEAVQGACAGRKRRGLEAGAFMAELCVRRSPQPRREDDVFFRIETATSTARHGGISAARRSGSSMGRLTPQAAPRGGGAAPQGSCHGPQWAARRGRADGVIAGRGWAKWERIVYHTAVVPARREQAPPRRRTVPPGSRSPEQYVPFPGEMSTSPAPRPRPGNRQTNAGATGYRQHRNAWPHARRVQDEGDLAVAALARASSFIA